LTEEEQAILRAIAAFETENGRPPALNDIAEQTGIPIERARAVLSRLLNELGLVQEQPGDGIERPVYATTGRAGTRARPADEERIEPNLALQLERLVDGVRFPSHKRDLVRTAIRHGAPEALRFAMQQLPDDRMYLNLQDLADAVAEQLDRDVSS
jgi:hypothetical protein